MSQYYVNSFSEVDINSVHDQLTKKIISEIKGSGKEYIIGVDEEEYIQYLVSEFTIDPVTIDFDNEEINKPTVTKELVNDQVWRGSYETDVYNFVVKYPFTGSAVVFRIHPSKFSLQSTLINVDEKSFIVSFEFKLYSKDPEEFKKTKQAFRIKAFGNLEYANADVAVWNNQLEHIISNHFRVIKNNFQAENDFYAAINVKVNEDTKSVFSTPTIKKKVIPKPSSSSKKEFSSQPTMSRKMYDDILKVIYEAGKSMEKKPTLYLNKDEEGLRDQFLFVLETRYEGTTATGETFNRSGKTDILLKYAEDSSNLFVAECKFWQGSSEFLKAISQLFDRYLTWRDSKTAVILFVKNQDFTNVLQTIRNDIVNHNYYLRSNGDRGESSFSYIFRLPQDAKKHVFLEIIAFHYDK